MRLSPRNYQRIAVAALFALGAIVVTGAAVRLTGSGLGCDDWPNCNNEKLIDVSTSHAAIEQVNRLFTGVVALSVMAAVLGSLLRLPRRRDLTWLSLGLVAGVLGQIVLGGVTVLVDLHPLAVQAHFLLSMVLLANAVALVERSGRPDGVPIIDRTSRASRTIVRVLAVLTTVAIVTGTVVTGTGPHAGDENARRFDLSISSVARIHGISVIATIATALVLAYVMRRDRGDRRALERPVSSWMFVAVLQAAVGYVQYFSGVPAILVMIHILGATVLFVMTMRLLYALGGPTGVIPVDETDELRNAAFMR